MRKRFEVETLYFLERLKKEGLAPLHVPPYEKEEEEEITMPEFEKPVEVTKLFEL